MSEPKRIVIPGGSGQLGQLLARHFTAQGHAVTVLSRDVQQPSPWQTMRWDAVTEGAWLAALEGSDVCINLTGRSVNCRYTPANRAEIYNSRVCSTQLLNEVIRGLAKPPKVWLNASTATIYRHAARAVADRKADREMDEWSGELGGSEIGVPETWRFSVKVAKDWETAFFAEPLPLVRRVALRNAVTFHNDAGSVFDVMSRLVRWGLGGANGTGAQYVSWIHGLDFIRAVDWLISREDMEGPVNVSSPHPLPNREFIKALCQAWGQPIGLPSARWMVELGAWLMGNEAELVMKSRRVVPARLLQAGFRFEFPEWPTAARDLVARWRTRSSMV